jgi:suppressor of tumorigenicity protein 13
MDIMQNPANIAKYMNDPNMQEVIAALASKMGGGRGGGMPPGFMGGAGAGFPGFNTPYV